MTADGAVWYSILAHSRPRFWLTRLMYPLARRAQKRFARHSMAAVKQAVAGAARPLAATAAGQ
jgi:uncharacterized protein (UPF0548 family)